MKLILELLYKNTKRNGFSIIVVGNSAYGNLAIPTDIILAQLGKKVGFKIKEIIVARKNETSSQQHAKLGKYEEYLRESILVMKK
jgi:site-specific DNA-methyltransferase (adenine-specific)